MVEHGLVTRRFGLNGVGFVVRYPRALADLGGFFDSGATRFAGEFGCVESTILLNPQAAVPVGTKISGRIHVSGDELTYRFDDQLLIRLARVEPGLVRQSIEVRTGRRKRSVLAGLIEPGEGIREFRTALFVQALRHAVVYPYFALLHLERGVSMLHGSAFSLQGRGFGVIGFDGVGKSAVADEARRRGALLLSDNFLVCDDRHLYAVPEPLRLRVTRGGHLFGKRFERLGAPVEKVELQGLVNTRLGGDYHLSPAEAGIGERLGEMFFRSLPEFHDLGRYLVALELRNGGCRVRPVDRLPPARSWYENERSVPEDNARLIDDIQKL